MVAGAFGCATNFMDETACVYLADSYFTQQISTKYKFVLSSTDFNLI